MSCTPHDGCWSRPHHSRARWPGNSILSNRLADWSCRCDKANSVDWQMGPYIHSLDRRFKYFVVTGMDKGLHMW